MIGFVRRGAAIASLSVLALIPALPASAGTDLAQPTGQSALADGWHFWGSSWSRRGCVADGRHTGLRYKCVPGKGADGQWKWHLYVWY